MPKYFTVWVASPDAGLEKRQRPAQLAFHPEDDSRRVAIVFRVTGERISNDESNCNHKSVDVYWQQSA